MEHILENDVLKVTISDHGAELVGVYDKEKACERLWDGNPDIWNRHAPILFPFIGRVKDHHYTYEGKTYEMTGHGFARDKEFELVRWDATSVTHVLRSDEETKKVYPFAFSLYVRHSIKPGKDRTISVEWRVVNDGTGEMIYSIGGHPAFRFPDGLSATDCYLRIPDAEENLVYLLLQDGCIKLGESYELALDGDTAPITAGMFDRDAFICLGNQVNAIEILDAAKKPYVRMDCKGFPCFGIWSKPSIPFLCLEPWVGIADTAGHDGELTHKKETTTIQGGESREYWYSMTLC